MTTLREAAQQALEALEIPSGGQDLNDMALAVSRATAALRAALEQPEPPPEAQTEAEKIAYCAGWWAAMEKMREPVPTRAPKENDRVICIEDESLGTVLWTDAAGDPYIKFDDGSYGQWMLHEFGKLFRYAALEQSEQS